MLLIVFILAKDGTKKESRLAILIQENLGPIYPICNKIGCVCLCGRDSAGQSIGTI